MAGLSLHVFSPTARKKDVDAREDGVPAARRGGVSLRGHDGGDALPSMTLARSRYVLEQTNMSDVAVANRTYDSIHGEGP
jgi:hypothetical protein